MSPAVKPSAAGPSAAPATDVTPAAMAAAKLGMIDKLLAAIDKQPHLTKARDLEGETWHLDRRVLNCSQRMYRQHMHEQAVHAYTMRLDMVMKNALSGYWRSGSIPYSRTKMETLPSTLQLSMGVQCPASI